MGEQGIRHDLARVAQGVQHATEIHRVPQGDGRRDQGEATGAVLLRLSGAVAQAPESVEADGTGQRGGTRPCSARP